VAAGDLTTSAAVKAYGGGQWGVGSAADLNVQTLITAASLFITNYTQRKFTSNPYSEIRNGTGGTEMMLANPPVTAMTSLSIDNTPIPAQPAPFQPGYFLVGTDMIAVYGYVFTRARRNVYLAYVAGYASVPTDIAQACNEMVVAAYRRGPRGPDVDSHTSQLTHETTRFKLAWLTPAAREAIDWYRRIVPL
jgi:hypothetical protein